MKKNIFIMILVLSVSIITLVIFLPFLPSKIPAHYNYLGEVDRYGSKYENFIWPVCIFVVELVFWTIGKIQKRQNEENQENGILLLGTAMGITIYILQIYFTLRQLPEINRNSGNANIWGFISIAEGILFLMIGNILPKVTKNETIGLRLPWTLENSEKWSKGQKFAAKVFVITGFVLIFIGIVFRGIICGIIQFCVLAIWVFVLILGSAVKFH